MALTQWYEFDVEPDAKPTKWEALADLKASDWFTFLDIAAAHRFAEYWTGHLRGLGHIEYGSVPAQDRFDTARQFACAIEDAMSGPRGRTHPASWDNESFQRVVTETYNRSEFRWLQIDPVLLTAVVGLLQQHWAAGLQLRTWYDQLRRRVPLAA